MIAIVGDVFVKTDKIADYVPSVSSVTNFIDLFQKHAIQPCMGKNSVAKSHYYTHLQGKSSLRSILLLIPILGNFLIAIYDFCIRKDQQSLSHNKNQPKPLSETDHAQPHKRTVSLSSTPLTPSQSQVEEIEQACKEWMTDFLKDFDPSRIRTYTFEQLYKEDVVVAPKETSAMQQVVEVILDPKKAIWEWEKSFPEGWKVFCRSNRSLGIVNSAYPNHIFKICIEAPGRGIPGAHFLRVPKGKELQGIIHEVGLDELAVVKESLLALKPREEIQKVSEKDQPFYFIVKSKKMNLLDEEQTIATLASLPVEKQIKIATQVMQLICKSGLGDVGFHNFQIDTDTGKLVIVDTEPLFGSLILNEERQNWENEWQYEHTEKLKPHATNSIVVKTGLKNTLASCEKLPIFKAVAKAYVENFIV